MMNEKCVFSVKAVTLKQFSQNAIIVSVPKCFSNSTLNINLYFVNDSQAYLVAKSINKINQIDAQWYVALTPQLS